MNQEFAELARNVLEVQSYPDLRVSEEAPPLQPYDVAGWTLAYQFGVEVIEVTTPLSDDVRAAMNPVEGEVADWQPLFRAERGSGEPRHRSGAVRQRPRFGIRYRSGRGGHRASGR